MKTPGCTYQLLVEDAKNRMKSKACNQPPTCSGFCAQHAYCAEVLAEAGKAGYPRMEIAPGYFVRSGALHWQAYAEKHRRERHSELLRKLRNANVARPERQETALLVEVG